MAEQTVYFLIQLAIFGNKKMEVDPETWPLLKGFISDAWVSENLPLLEPRDPTEGSDHIPFGTPEPQQIDTAARDLLAVHKYDSPATSNSVSVLPDSSQTTGRVGREAGSGPSNIEPVHPRPR